MDENNNSFFSFPVKQEIVGFSTAGTFQPNFVAQSNNLLSSGIIKFSPMGQKIWATYCLASVSLLSYHNGALYFATGYDANAPWAPTTAGTFQPTAPADTIIMKWDANTGQRVWSTFYGTYNVFDLMGVYGLKATDSGLYISGSSGNASYPTYYATPGAHKTQLTGEEDLFLSKFDMQTGRRIWSTYFGSDGYDTIMGSQNIDVWGERIVITGNQFGANGNIATPGAFLTTPQSTAPHLSNKFFAEFEAEGGSLVWASYFGGVTSGASPEEINPKFLNDGTLLLWGDTSSMTGVTTANGYFPTKILSSETIGFLTRFAFNNMATQESNASQDLQLYDNPNNGNFSLVGNALAQKNLQLKLYDASGRLVITRKLNNEKKQSFEFQYLLSKGNYIIEVSRNKTTLKTFKMIVK